MDDSKDEDDIGEIDYSVFRSYPIRCTRCGLSGEQEGLSYDEDNDGYPDGWKYLYYVGLLCGTCAPIVNGAMRQAAFTAIVDPVRVLAPEAAAWTRPEGVKGRYAAVLPDGGVAGSGDTLDDLDKALDGKGVYTKIWIHIRGDDRTREQGPTFPTERHLRQEWWFNHGCPSWALYGDDGEMSCSLCLVDFRRMVLDTLWAHVQERRAVEMRVALDVAAAKDAVDDEDWERAREILRGVKEIARADHPDVFYVEQLIPTGDL